MYANNTEATIKRAFNTFLISFLIIIFVLYSFWCTKIKKKVLTWAFNESYFAKK